MITSTRPPEPTYRCAIAVTLRRRSENLELVTSNVGFHGAFIRTITAPPVNSLVRLVVTLPPDDAKIELSAHVTQVILPSTEIDHYPGFATRFVALNGPPKKRWESFIQVLRSDESSPRETLLLARPSYMLRLDLAGPAGKDIAFRPPTVEDLTRFIDEDIASGGFFLPTEQALVLGASVNVQVVHPITSDTFRLPCVVRRRGTEAQRGVLVRLAPMTDVTRAALKEFAESVIVLTDYDIELFDAPVLS